MWALSRALPALLLIPLIACSGGEAPDRIVEGVNLSALFAPPTQAEIDAVKEEWSRRDVSAQGVEIVATTTDGDLEVVVVSHTVGGVRHYGAILAPIGAQPDTLPILVYAHGGDGGVDVDDLLAGIPLLLPNTADSFLFVIPSFRDEPLDFDETRYRSEGPASPWDRDVDDALALVNVADQLFESADPDRIGVLGFSRGGCVGLLMAIRDPRIDLVVEFFGPTDFFGPFVQEVTEEALRGTPRDLPGLDYLDAELIQPLKSGAITEAELRLEMLRRSPVYFAERLPEVQVHHGTADDTVPVGEAERLIEVMRSLGRDAPEFEAYLYPGAGHDPLQMPASFPRTRQFLERLD
jgi:dipeptidyl aminopeptidase/acylaminoacyl peptidase